MEGFLFKYISKYLSSRVIFLLDLVLATLASAFSIFCVFSIVGPLTFNPDIAILYLGCSVVFYAAGELLFHPYHNAIRHMTLMDMALLAMTAAVKDIGIFVLALCLGRFSRLFVFFIFFDFLLPSFHWLAAAYCRPMGKCPMALSSTTLEEEPRRNSLLPQWSLNNRQSSKRQEPSYIPFLPPGPLLRCVVLRHC